ncbi:7808_t:CDS:2 [Entrophospora sp. SA101]|nr:20057_t:CDS:2 [Entrophospora sp. SA101]CAJ0845957.1 14746_t:CDS:2 [Entrophospora sp. SA101]CAJ0908896.1 7808_t:CDS:2 [Entrophospora sp. SA101]
MEEEPSVTIIEKGGAFCYSYFEEKKDGEKSKGVICQVNVSEVFDIIVPCNVVVCGSESTSNYITHLYDDLKKNKI